MKRWYDIKNAASPEAAEVLIYDDIGYFGVSADQFVRELAEVAAPLINVRVNSEGGEVFDGFAIYNALRRHPSRIVCHVDGLAASAATYPVLAGDEVRIASNGMLMIHNPASLVMGEAADMRQEADLLDKLAGIIANLYSQRTGKPVEEVRGWMTAETWFTAEEAKANGFVDTVIDERAEREPAKNRRRAPILNNAGARVRVGGTLEALGLSDVLAPANAVTPKETTPMVTIDEVRAFAAQNPDAVRALDVIQNHAAAEFGRGKEEAKRELAPKNASASELKAAFPDDRDFVMDRLDKDAPLNDHKVAYAEHLKAKLTNLGQENERLKNRVAEIDPAYAGSTSPVNTVPDDNSPTPISPERRRHLLNLAGCNRK